MYTPRAIEHNNFKQNWLCLESKQRDNYEAKFTQTNKV